MTVAKMMSVDNHFSYVSPSRGRVPPRGSKASSVGRRQAAGQGGPWPSGVRARYLPRENGLVQALALRRPASAPHARTAISRVLSDASWRR